MDEQISGPIRGGYYVAAYACPAGEHNYAGYFKIFTTPVQSYFDDGICALKGAVDGAWTSPAEALALAFERGRSAVMNLRPADRLPFVQECRRPFHWELRR